MLFGLSTSGNSANILKAIEAAQAKGMKTIALTGKDGGKMAGCADIETEFHILVTLTASKRFTLRSFIL